GYENVHIIEPSVSIPKKSEFVDIPDIWLMFNKNILVFDHYLNKLYIVTLLIFEEKGDLENLYTKTLEEIDRIEKTIKTTIPLPKELKIISNFNFGMKNYEANISKENFLKIIKKAKEYVYNGDVIQVVISRRLSKITEADPFDIYRCLRIINPSPYMFYLRFTNNLSLIGSSPEILVRKESNIVETRPIAGTRQRGTTEEEELKYEKALINSKKENAEHIMLVDLARNDLGRISKFSSVYLPQFRTIEKFSHVMHLVSSVKATLKEDVDSIDVLKACFPAGTVSGAPKVRAMQIISELENTTRGPYSGAVGYFSLTGDMDMAITIRTIVYFNKNVYIQTGAGIVSDSEPINEYNETLHKAKALLLAIAIAENSNIKK
ncbi:MAG: anthranilate synthase component I family protein, partial [Endomicrobia bacterium]|nr:anthranilate synthase component I family protein [Endomicrobiia bacterium]